MRALRDLSSKMTDWDPANLNGTQEINLRSMNRPPPGASGKRKAPGGDVEEEENQPLQHPFQLKKMKIKDPEYMSQVPNHLQNKEIPGFPSVTLCIGEPGSGKTNLLMNLLTRDDLWKGFFDKIYLLGPTVKSDKLYKHLNIPEDQIVTDQKEFLTRLIEWTDQQIKEVKINPDEAMKCLFIFEDFTSYNKTIQKSPDFIKCFNAIRHHKASVYINIHKVKALERTARMSCGNVIVFPLNKTEVDALYEDYGPKNLHKKDWALLCDDAWTPDQMSQKPFLYINKAAPREKWFRKCFTHIFNIKDYEGKYKFTEKRKQEEEKAKHGHLLQNKTQNPTDPTAPPETPSSQNQSFQGQEGAPFHYPQVLQRNKDHARGQYNGSTLGP